MRTVGSHLGRIANRSEVPDKGGGHGRKHTCVSYGARQANSHFSLGEGCRLEDIYIYIYIHIYIYIYIYIYICMPHCIVNPSNQRPCDSKGTECQPAGMYTKRPTLVPPWCCERCPGGHQQARVHGSELGWCHLHPVHQNVTALLGTPGESSKAAVHHHQNAPRQRNQQDVVLRSRPGQPLALVCMPRQWAVLRLGGCVSGNHMWCRSCLVMPGVKRRPIRWNQTSHHVLHGTNTTRISDLGTPRIGCCCCYCFSVALAALDPRVIAAKDLDSTPKALLTCRLPAASADSTTDSGLVRPERGRDGVGGG